MAEWRVLICDPLAENGINLLREHAQVDDRAGISAEELATIISKYDALVVRGRTKVTAELLERAAKLKIIARAGVGVDNIDWQAAAKLGIPVVNTPTATTIAVAEHTLALLLTLARRIPQANASLKSGLWEKKSLIGMELAGKTMGIIGAGRIGQAVAARVQSFKMDVLGYDPLVPDADLKLQGITPIPLDALYARADMISVHTPLNEETTGMIDATAFAKMKPGAIIISTARGGIVDEAALLENLTSGHIAGAALDVFENEPPGKSRLVSHPNLIATPHIAAQTGEAQARAAQHAAEEIIRRLEGLPLRWQIG